MLYFQLPSSTKSQCEQEVISIPSESEVDEMEGEEDEMEVSPLSDCQFETISSLPDPDEPSRSVGFSL